MPTTISDYTATLTFDPNLYASRFIEINQYLSLTPNDFTESQLTITNPGTPNKFLIHYQPNHFDAVTKLVRHIRESINHAYLDSMFGALLFAWIKPNPTSYNYIFKIYNNHHHLKVNVPKNIDKLNIPFPGIDENIQKHFRLSTYTQIYHSLYELSSRSMITNPNSCNPLIDITLAKNLQSVLSQLTEFVNVSPDLLIRTMPKDDHLLDTQYHASAIIPTAYVPELNRIQYHLDPRTIDIYKTIIKSYLLTLMPI